MLAPNLKVVKSAGKKKSGHNWVDCPVYNAIRQYALDGLNDMLQLQMEQVDDRLFDLSDKVGNDRHRTLYFEAMRDIRMKRQALQNAFDRELHRSFDSLASSRVGCADRDEEDELTLVELDEMEDRLAIDNMVRRARPHFEDELFEIGERLKALLQIHAISEDENPLDPRAICEAFHAACTILEAPIQIKLILYKLFEKCVMKNLGHFYHELNALFVRNAILPDFNADRERRNQTTRFLAKRVRQAATASPGSTRTRDIPTDDPVQGGVTGSGIACGQDAPPKEGISKTRGPSVPLAEAVTDGAPVNCNNFIPDLTSLQRICASTQPLAQIDPQAFRGETQKRIDTFRATNRHRFTTSETRIIDLVSSLFDYFFDDDALPKQIRVLIGRLHIPILKVALLNKHFFDQENHPARQLLDGISRASLGLSENPDESTRLISKTEEIVESLLAEFREDIAVFEQAHRDFERFVYRENRRHREAEAALLVKEKEKERRIQSARKAASALIGKLISDRELNAEVVQFLETTWNSVLLHVYLSLGESSQHWRNLRRISASLVWTLVPKHTEAERTRIIQTIPALLRALSKGMELIDTPMKDRNRIFGILAREHARIVKQTSRNVVTRVDDTTVWPEDAAARALANASEILTSRVSDVEFLSEAADSIEVIESQAEESITIIGAADNADVIRNLNLFTIGVKRGHIRVDEEIVLGSEGADDFDELQAVQDDYLEQARSIEIDSWVEFNRPDENSLVARLSWKSEQIGNLVFVNRSGNKVRNISISGLAAELRNGQARYIGPASVFERAIQSIVSRFQH